MARGLTETEKVEASGTIAMRMNLLKFELGELGLFRTMHAMDAATGQLGWELAAVQTGDARHVEAGERYNRAQREARR